MDRRRFLASSAALPLALSPAARAWTALGDQPDALSSETRAKLKADPLRPQYHLLPRANWMNDPCAPRFYRGTYHMFFQHNPFGAVWGNMSWGHATSPDMIHWTHQPLALAATPGSYDAFACFTGSVLPGMETPSILYTGVTKSSPEQETIRGEGSREVQCFASSTDPQLRTWTKAAKPVLDAPPPGIKVTGFRDPCPWKDGDTWYLIVGSGIERVGGCVLLYRSADGHAWEYLHPLAQGKWNGGTQTNPVDTGEMWECPDFFPLGAKHVLLYSTERKVYWEVGSFDRAELKFKREKQGLLDHGSYYAMKSMLDAKGRRILWGWSPEQRSEDEMKAAGWSGCMALPRVLSLGAEGGLRMEVPPEFRSLIEHSTTTRDAGAIKDTKHGTATPESTDAGLRELTVANRAGIVIWKFRQGTTSCGVELRSGADLLLSLSSVGGRLSVGEKQLSLAPAADGVSTVEIWIDGSILEVFVDQQEAITVRSYSGGSAPIHVAATGLSDSIVVAPVRPISPDRLTS